MKEYNFGNLKVVRDSGTSSTKIYIDETLVYNYKTNEVEMSVEYILKYVYYKYLAYVLFDEYSDETRHLVLTTIEKEYGDLFSASLISDKAPWDEYEYTYNGKTHALRVNFYYKKGMERCKRVFSLVDKPDDFTVSSRALTISYPINQRITQSDLDRIFMTLVT